MVVSYHTMGTQVRVNRDHNHHRWTVHSLTHGMRLGNATGLLLRDVTFVHEGPSGWADGELWTWAEMQLDPKFSERLEARTVDYLDTQWWPLEFRESRFYLKGCNGVPLTGCGWLRIEGREASVAFPTSC